MKSLVNFKNYIDSFIYITKLRFILPSGKALNQLVVLNDKVPISATSPLYTLCQSQSSKKPMLKRDQKCKDFRKFPCKRKQGRRHIRLSETSDYDASLTLSEEEREVVGNHPRLDSVKPCGSPQAKPAIRGVLFVGNGCASV